MMLELCASGIENTISGGALTYAATSHTFTGNMYLKSTPKIGNLTVATIDQIPSLTGYALLDSPAFTG